MRYLGQSFVSSLVAPPAVRDPILN